MRARFSGALCASGRLVRRRRCVLEPRCGLGYRHRCAGDATGRRRGGDSGGPGSCPGSRAPTHHPRCTGGSAHRSRAARGNPGRPPHRRAADGAGGRASHAPCQYAPHTFRRTVPGDGAPAAADLAYRCDRPRSRPALWARIQRTGRPGHGSLRRPFLLGAACAFPCLACGSRELARTLGLAFRLFETLTRALELILRDAYALLGDVGLQPHPVERFGCRILVAACFLHPVPAKRKRTSLTQGLARFHLG